MRLVTWAATRIPALRRLREGRDRLLEELAPLRAERDRLAAGSPALLAEIQALRDSLLALEVEVAPMRLAAREHRLFMTDYAYHPQERPLAQAAAGQQLAARFAAERPRYAQTLRGLARHAGTMGAIPRDAAGPLAPHWDNPWFPPFDAASLYGLLAENAPGRYIEVGSGISTRFARQAIADLGLSTRIVSIDPHPHNAVEGLCDETIVARMEDMPASFWAGLAPGDMVFIDNSHRCFPGSDVTVFFGEVMPALPPGIVYGLHDIFLPNDYPDSWKERFYSEQYLLMAYLLGGAGRDEILLPVAWAANEPDLHALLAPLWSRPGLFDGLKTQGGCFWLRRGAAA